MGLSKSAIEAVKRECRLICFGFLGGFGAHWGTPTAEFVKFEGFIDFLKQIFGETYSENVTPDDFLQWMREFANAKPR